jgi:DNA-binding beta-propeller fold protein YncE
MNPSTGTLALNCSCSTEGNGAQGIAVDPFGKFTLIANTGSNDVSIGVPDVGELATIAAGMSPVAITFDPTFFPCWIRSRRNHLTLKTRNSQ